MENQKKDKKEYTKFQKFILSLDEKVKIGDHMIKKKFILAIMLAVIILVLYNLFSVMSTPKATTAENEKIYNQAVEAQQKKFNGGQSVPKYQDKSPEEIQKQYYEESIKQLLNMSDEEIKSLLRSQGLEVNDQTIKEFREQIKKNLSGTAQDLQKNVEEFQKQQNQQGQVQNSEQVPETSPTK